jgi:hypothetical protein
MAERIITDIITGRKIKVDTNKPGGTDNPFKNTADYYAWIRAGKPNEWPPGKANRTAIPGLELLRPQRRPDGLKVLDTLDSQATNIKTGVAAVKGAFDTANKAAEFIDKHMNKNSAGKAESGEVTNVGEPSKKATNTLPNVVENPLEQFASMSPLWTLAVLTSDQFNKPSSYRSSDLSFAKHKQNIIIPGGPNSSDNTSRTFESGIIFSSAGRGDDSRVKTASGVPEYFIDNFRMSAAISASEKTGNTNALSFDFDIFEPYSMGLLLQSMQVAAVKAGWPNYLDAPYLLKLDFQGFDEDMAKRSSIKAKYFVLKFKTVTFDTNESGSSYKVSAFPYNHIGYLDTINMLFNDINISAPNKGTVEEMLKSGPNSLEKVLNDNELSLITAGKYSVPDQYIIEFPEKSGDWETAQNKDSNSSNKGATDKSSSSTTVVGGGGQVTKTTFGTNPIGKASFGFDAEQGGNFNFSRAGDAYNEETGRVDRYKMSINQKSREFLFTQKQPLTDVITQVILSSKYAKDAISGTQASNNLTPEGFIKWFRIDIQVEFLGYDVQIGDFAKRYTYRVVPYFVHQSIFKTPGSVVDTLALQKTIAKHYQYLYTGQNTDVLKFDIQINNLFFTGTDPTNPANTSSEQNQDQRFTVSSPPTGTNTPKPNNSEAAAGNLGKTKTKRDITAMLNRQGGSGFKDVEKQIADSFQKAFTQNGTTDLVKLDLEILGDTYWLVDSGIGNYVAQSQPRSMTTADGSANYEGQDVYIYLSFRTPIDVNTDSGLYDFKNSAPSPFSGVYKVIKVDSEFKSGNFTQTLKCLRMQQQEVDFDGQLPKGADTNTPAVVLGNKVPEKTNITQQIATAKDWTTLSFDNLINASKPGGSLETSANDFLRSLGLPTGPVGSLKPADSESFKSKPKLIEKRRQANGTLVNFNIDRSQPFSESFDSEGNTIRIYGEIVV